MLQINVSGISLNLSEEENEKTWIQVEKAHELIEKRSGEGADFFGWTELPFKKNAEYEKIKQTAKRIQQDSQVFVVVGIGGSLLGMKAALEMIKSPEYNILPKNTPDILFAGENLSDSALYRLLKQLEGKDFSVNVISKSGNTIETAVAFRLLRKAAEERYGSSAAERIYVTTSAKKGALKTLADKKGYTCFTIPDNVGGRYSVLSSVGLLPMAVAGINIDKVLQGAAEMANTVSEKGRENPAWRYARMRRLLYSQGKKIEFFASYEPSLRCMAEWWKQLYSESEGKGGKGIFPASISLTADLHSMGQYIQDGERSLMETVISVKYPGETVKVPYFEDDTDNLNYLSGKSLSYLNLKAKQATEKAHIDGGVPCIEIEIDALDENSFGELVYFFEFACALSGYIGGVNPFDQPGVEEYKKNMKILLKG